jgi:hypothetical protein
MHAMLGDTTRVYPPLEVCRRDPGGSTSAATRRDLAYTPYRGQPHFQRLTNDITPVGKKRGGVAFPNLQIPIRNRFRA